MDKICDLEEKLTNAKIFHFKKKYKTANTAICKQQWSVVWSAIYVKQVDNVFTWSLSYVNTNKFEIFCL